MVDETMNDIEELDSEVGGKREKFINSATQRTEKVLIAIENLGKCANPKSLEYSIEDVEKMFSAIEEETLRVRRRFEDTLTERKPFSF